MASRNFHKRRTKERKDRQRAERTAQRTTRRRGFDPGPLVMAGATVQAGVALAAILGARPGVPLVMDVPQHAPKMFVKNGKLIPFDNL